MATVLDKFGNSPAKIETHIKSKQEVANGLLEDIKTNTAP